MEKQINTSTKSDSLINNEINNNIIEEETSILNKKTINNTEKELENIPIIIKNYLKDNNLGLITFSNIESVQIIKCALLKKTENIRTKDFLFQLNEDQLYYFFITKEDNPNYLKKKKVIDNRISIKLRMKNEEEEEKKEEENEINLNFDYNKYILKSVIMKIPNASKVKTEIYKTDILDREICQVSNTTLESINYYQTTKTIKPETAKKN